MCRGVCGQRSLAADRREKMHFCHDGAGTRAVFAFCYAGPHLLRSPPGGILGMLRYTHTCTVLRQACPTFEGGSGDNFDARGAVPVYTNSRLRIPPIAIRSPARPSTEHARHAGRPAVVRPPHTLKPRLAVCMTPHTPFPLSPRANKLCCVRTRRVCCVPPPPPPRPHTL